MHKDIWFNILLQNNIDDLKSIVCVNHLFNNILKDYYFWTQYYTHHQMILITNDIYKTTYDWIKSVEITLQTNNYINHIMINKYNNLHCYVNDYNILKNINVKYIRHSKYADISHTELYRSKNNFKIYHHKSVYYFDIIDCHRMIYDFIKNNIKIVEDDAIT